jgi:HJR/Mrr/RecB family endonuclease
VLHPPEGVQCTLRPPFQIILFLQEIAQRNEFTLDELLDEFDSVNSFNVGDALKKLQEIVRYQLTSKQLLKRIIFDLLMVARFDSSIIEDKVELCKIINELSYGMYRLYQNTHECDDEKNKKTKEYLQITSEQILLNEEVTEYLKEVDWNNSDTFIYDSDLDYENNISIFSV